MKGCLAMMNIGLGGKVEKAGVISVED